MIDRDKVRVGWEMSDQEDDLFEKRLVRFKIIVDIPKTELACNDPGLALSLLLADLVAEAEEEYLNGESG
jgi:hypothetical protein